MNTLSVLPTFVHLQAMLLRQAIATLTTRTPTGRFSDSKPSAFDDIILEACERHAIDPALIKGLIKAESGFKPTAVSAAGAKGLMQLMDETAKALGVTDVFDPKENIEAGVLFLSRLLERYNNNETLALAAYNAGPGAVDKYKGVPPLAETQAYVPRVLAYKEQFSAFKTWEA